MLNLLQPVRAQSWIVRLGLSSGRRVWDLAVVSVTLALGATSCSFASAPSGGNGLFVLHPDGAVARLGGTGSSGSTAAWSPDGSQVAFGLLTSERSSLAVVRRDGTHMRVLADAAGPSPVALAWQPGGSRVAFIRRASGQYELALVDTLTGRVRTIAGHAVRPGSDPGVSFSPNGRHVAYLRPGGAVISASVDGGATRVVASTGSSKRMSEAAPHWSPDGRWILYLARPKSRHGGVVLVHPDGSTLHGVSPAVFSLAAAAWSPDSTRIAINGWRDHDPSCHLFIVDLRRGSIHAITGEIPFSRPTWSPDGRRIAFTGRAGELETITPEGTDQATLHSIPHVTITALAWSPNGTDLLYRSAPTPEGD